MKRVQIIEVRYNELEVYLTVRVKEIREIIDIVKQMNGVTFIDALDNNSYNFTIYVAKLIPTEEVMKEVLNLFLESGFEEYIEVEVEEAEVETQVKPSWLKRFWSSVKELFANS